jgi:methylthioribose-1-phosphate isomerase
MRVGNKHFQTIWLDEADPSVVKVIDQQKLPFFFEIKELRSVEDVYSAIDNMTVRGAPLIGAAAAFGIYLATLEITVNTSPVAHLHNAAKYLVSCRPTAVNLSWAVNYMMSKLNEKMSIGELTGTTLKSALEICELEKENCRQIGIHGLPLIEEISRKKKGEVVNILTHCNAGWLACIDYGTATAPIYLAHDKGIKLHVWVDETRPRNQGARLTAWELGQHGVPHTVIPDNAGGHLMQHGKVDLVIVGSDRTTLAGDSANKIGTYLKALAAYDNNISFYSAVPSTSIDFRIKDGISDIVIEERDSAEVLKIEGLLHGKIEEVRLCPENSQAANFGFDVTPARLISGIITEKGICRADEESIKALFPDKIN